jgi:LacI family transcriptional regulator
MQIRPTIRDIAERTGLSAAAISMALRDHPRIGAATRERVRQVALEMGYTPDPVMASIAARRWQRNPSEKGPVLAALLPTVAEPLPGLVEMAGQRGYRIEQTVIAASDRPEEIGRRLWWRGITGLILGQSVSPDFCRAFDWSKFAAVGCGEGQCRLPIDVVMPDHYAAVQDAWDQVWARGYRRIGLALFDLPAELDVREREAAYWERQRHSHAEELPILRLPSSHVQPEFADHQRWFDHSAVAMRKWIRDCRPEAVLGFNATFRWLLEGAGYAVPKRMVFADLWISSPKEPDATGMALYQTEVSASAIDWLDLLLRTGQRGLAAHPRTIRLEPVWRDGPWLPPKAAASAKRTRPRR